MGTNAASRLNFSVESRVNGNDNDIRRFGVFEVDLRAGELRRNGIRIKLQEQPFQVLSLLLERPGEVVSRDEVRQRLWPADTFVDFDHSLNAAIRRLRDALGDSADNPTFVETVARRGYRFLAPVIPVSSHGHAALPPISIAPAQETSSSTRRVWIVAGIAALALIIVGIVLGFHLSPHEPPPLRISRVTANPVDDPVIASAISHDGRYLAFSDESGFYLRQIDTGETHAIALPPGLLPNSLSWFPDNVHMVLSLCGVDRESSLWTISVLGGSARKIIESGAHPAVSPDGKQVAYIAGKLLRQRIWLAGIDGELPRVLAGEDGDMFGTINWSPGGTKVAYTTAKASYGYGSEGKIAIVDSRSNAAPTPQQPTIGVSLHGLEAPFAWASDNGMILTQAEARPRDMDSNLWAVHLNRAMKADQPPVRLTSDQGKVLDVNASLQAGRIAYIKALPQPDVYIAQVQRNGTLTEPRRLTMDDREDLPYDWTPDGQDVIFASNRTGTFDVYKQDIHNAVPELLVSGAQNALQARLSPDGSEILYMAMPSWGDPGYEVPLMIVPFAGGPPRQIAKAKWISNHQCARAPATTCIYSVLGDTGLTFFRFSPAGTGASQVFELKDDLPQLYNWSLSPDGTTLAIAKGKHIVEEPRIHLVSLVDGSEKWLEPKGPALQSLDWASDSKSLWATTSVEKENSLVRIDLQGNERVVWTPKKGSVGWAIPSRDGKNLALHIHSSTANVWMLER